ncbi:MAG TPA: glycosyltransferase family 4 protein [Acidimicrobiales bacterium]
MAVPPTEYGGTELVVDRLARGLVAAGHDVELFATGDSTCPVPTRWVHRVAAGTKLDEAIEREQVRAAYEAFADVDLVHDHTVLGPPTGLAMRPELPLVTTNHGPFSPTTEAHFASVSDDVAVVAISDAQRRTAPSVRFAAVIHHGLDVAELPFGDGKGGYLLFLGRMSPDKGAHRAIAVARATGRRLLIAAKMWDPWERRYFEEQVEPNLGDGIEFLGEVGGARKLELLASAEALVNPISWSEPFGLAMIEALATGTPVLAFREGSVPEIVEHGRTGFICRDVDDMAMRVSQLDRIDRAACRASAVERFSSERFVDEHLALYRSILAKRGDLVA